MRDLEGMPCRRCGNSMVYDHDCTSYRGTDVLMRFEVYVCRVCATEHCHDTTPKEVWERKKPHRMMKENRS